MSNSIKHPLYSNYPEQPYISPDRDLKAWENNPDEFPYGIVEKRQMIRLPEDVLPGDIILLWRIHFNNFTNAAIFPQYFEYRYGIDASKNLLHLIKLGYIEVSSAAETLEDLNLNQLKKLLKQANLPINGKKAEILERITTHFTENELAPLYSLRKYKITPSGSVVLKNHWNIIERHGPKKIG